MQGWILPTLGALVVWGFWGFIPKLTTTYLQPKSAIVYEVVGALILGIIVLVSSRFQLDVHPKGIAFAITTGMLGFLGAFCFLMAVSRGPVTLVATMSALYPVISILLAVFILHESVTLQQSVGIALAILAMILVTA
ncbi:MULTISPECIES: EamA family transporter [Cyanophyceae]|jgi:transporter family protein|uniref:EamA family transporter n=1 Tax=Cyanophyceae TaxID=3028117 RepID=UPI00168328AC|nr:EamA family transporter [Trichocoleus sp. FACHB-40]MBD2004650.1 EamA family transporter [Trichocoleus sp. FACHB-40]